MSTGCVTLDTDPNPSFAEKSHINKKESYYGGDNGSYNLHHLLGASLCDVLLDTIVTKLDET